MVEDHQQFNSKKNNNSQSINNNKVNVMFEIIDPDDNQQIIVLEDINYHQTDDQIVKKHSSNNNSEQALFDQKRSDSLIIQQRKKSYSKASSFNAREPSQFLLNLKVKADSPKSQNMDMIIPELPKKEKKKSISPLLRRNKDGLSPLRVKKQKNIPATPNLHSKPLQIKQKMKEKSLLNQNDTEGKDNNTLQNKKKKIKILRNNSTTKKKNNLKVDDKQHMDVQSEGNCIESLNDENNLLINEDQISARSEASVYNFIQVKPLIPKVDPNNLKSILIRPSKRVPKAIKLRVVFADLPEYKQSEEEAKINQNRKKYKKEREQGTIGIYRFKKKMKNIQIKPDDPILQMPYSKYYLSDQIEKKKFYTEMDVCQLHIKELRSKSLGEKKVQQIQQRLLPKNTLPDLNSSLNSIKKKYCSEKKTILFELDNSLLYAVYKKNYVMAFDASTYVKLIGQQTFKLYLSYRNYLLDMLTKLKDDFEIILFSSKNSQKYVEKVAEAIEKNNEKYFDHLISTEDMFYYKDIDFYILDLNILLGQPKAEALQVNQQQQERASMHIKRSAEQNLTGSKCTRDLKDIIVVANTCGTYMFNLHNGIPIKEFYGNNQDLTFFSLTRYLKSFRDVKDVRVKIKEDFSLQITSLIFKMIKFKYK